MHSIVRLAIGCRRAAAVMKGLLYFPTWKIQLQNVKPGHRRFGAVLAKIGQRFATM